MPEDLWDAVQERMVCNTTDRSSPGNIRSTHILTGLIFDETGDRMSPTHAIKSNRRYRYYISARIMRERRKQSDGRRVPAAEIERPVLAALGAYLNDRNRLAGLVQSSDLSARALSNLGDTATTLASKLAQSDPYEQKRILASIVRRIELHLDRMTIDINTSKLIAPLSETPEQTELNLKSHSEIDRIELTHSIRKRGVETKIVLNGNGSDSRNPDPALIRAIAKSHLWRMDLASGKATSIRDLADKHGESAAEVSRFLPFAWLAPDIIENILNGSQPVDLTLERLRRMPSLPISWKQQRQLLGFEA
ncbi:MAG: hypothetical protein GY789_28740 [Hyphomicrobiales bacterium]|nr:hypothetical protein [Hyphomicrobiales bacterium]